MVFTVSLKSAIGGRQNLRLYMIKRGVLGALLIFDKIFFLSTHIARIWMEALTGRLMFHL